MIRNSFYMNCKYSLEKHDYNLLSFYKYLKNCNFEKTFALMKNNQNTMF